MKSQSKINLFLFLFLFPIISLSTFKNANASLQEQFNAQTCTFDNAPFQDTKYSDARYCINNNNKRITVIYDDGINAVQEGYLGGSEAYQGWIYEWVINSNKLIQYGCPGNWGRNCSGKVEITVEAIKR